MLFFTVLWEVGFQFRIIELSEFLVVEQGELVPNPGAAYFLPTPLSLHTLLWTPQSIHPS